MHRSFTQQEGRPEIPSLKTLLGQQECTKEVNHPIKCTLEDLYKGKTSRINVKRDRICLDCSNKKQKFKTCELCRGNRFIEVAGRRMACPSCDGAGKSRVLDETC